MDFIEKVNKQEKNIRRMSDDLKKMIVLKKRMEQSSQSDFDGIIKEGEKLLLCLKENELNNILIEEYNLSSETIKINFLTVLTEKIARQWIMNNNVNDNLEALIVDFIISGKTIIIRDSLKHSKIYYKHTLDTNEKILVEHTTIGDGFKAILRYGGLFMETSLYNAEILTDLFQGYKKDNLF